MAGRTPAEAVNNFLAPLQRALSCVTREVLSVGGGYHVSDTPHVLLFQNNPVMLGHDRRFALKLIQQYRIIEGEAERGPWKVATVAYYSTLETPETTASPSQEILGYHWKDRHFKRTFLPTLPASPQRAVHVAAGRAGALRTGGLGGVEWATGWARRRWHRLFDWPILR
jgi:hypothetical protein